MRRVPGVEVGVRPGNGRRLPERSGGAEEPQTISQYGTTVGSVDIECVDERRRFQNPDRPQFIVDIVCTRPLARAAVESRAGERVAARARHEIHDWPAGFCFTQAARYE